MRALHVDVHDDVPAPGQHPVHLGLQRAVEVAVHLRRLREFPTLPPADELAARQEVIVRSVHFTSPRVPRRARHRVPEIRPPGQQHPGDRRLAAARRRRENDREIAHSRFSTCSRIRSSSSLISTTSLDHRRVVALAPRGVRLAEHLLQQESQPLAHAVVRPPSRWCRETPPGGRGTATSPHSRPTDRREARSPAPAGPRRAPHRRPTPAPRPQTVALLD